MLHQGTFASMLSKNCLLLVFSFCIRDDLRGQAQPCGEWQAVEFTEGNLKISFPSSMKAEKFDDPKSHGLTHCMKAVDFIAERADSTLFIELKDPDHPQAKKENKNIFIKDFCRER